MEHKVTKLHVGQTASPRVTDVALQDKPRLAMAVRVARIMSHLFLLLAFGSVFVSAGVQNIEPAVICVSAFCLSFFAWVALVLFGFMNFALSSMLSFVLCVGACIALLISGNRALVIVGGLGLLVTLFATIIPVSRYDPTTPAAERKNSNPVLVFFLLLPLLCFAALASGGLTAAAGALGLFLIAVGVMLPDGPHGRPEWQEWDQAAQQKSEVSSQRSVP